jgi:glycosyltransferase involved in cell wall biosynthesis
VAALADPGVLLVIVGDGPQRDALNRQVAESGLGAQVVFAGQQADVAPWMKAFDAFALPSYANEGVPQALMQAMFTGLPCVTTAVGAIGEIAVPDRTALVVPAQDSEALAGALRALKADAALRERLGQAARAHCAAGFTLRAMLDHMERVFAAAASGGTLA